MTQAIQKRQDETLVLSPAGEFSASYIEEAPLYFAHGSKDIDPKHGLISNGPLDNRDGSPETIRFGIVSTAAGIDEVTEWANHFNNYAIEASALKPFSTETFPGFVKAFNCTLSLSKDYNEQINSKEVENLLAIRNANLRIEKAGELYAAKVENICRKVSVPDVVICHEPEPIERFCGAGVTGYDKRQASLPRSDREEMEQIRKNISEYDLLAPIGEDVLQMLDMAVNQDFRRTLKANCLQFNPPTQILTQSSLKIMMKHKERKDRESEFIHQKDERKKRQLLGEDPSTLAWNLAVAIYYKSNRSPWKVGYLSPGSCYIGVAFFFDQTKQDKNMFASLAQVFSDSGQGMVVRGDSFRWDVKNQGQPHLSEDGASDLVGKALVVYKKHHDGQAPNRVVIHKSSTYTAEELNGFGKGSVEVPRYDFISLSDGRDVFFYRNGDYPVLRGTTLNLPGKSVLVYTIGFVPYVRQYEGPRVPRPLEITEHHGDSTLQLLTEEIIALSRLNWNSTDYCCYEPITLKFARGVGEILGKVPYGAKVQEQYRYYM